MRPYARWTSIQDTDALHHVVLICDDPNPRLLHTNGSISPHLFNCDSAEHLIPYDQTPNNKKHGYHCGTRGICIHVGGDTSRAVHGVVPFGGRVPMVWPGVR